MYKKNMEITLIQIYAISMWMETYRYRYWFAELISNFAAFFFFQFYVWNLFIDLIIYFCLYNNGEWINAGAAMLTDCIFWYITVPFQTIKDYNLNFESIVDDLINLAGFFDNFFHYSCQRNQKL